MALMNETEFKKLEEEFHKEVKKRESKIRLEAMQKDLELAKEAGRGYNTVCCHLTSEEQDMLYIFLKEMFTQELEEILN